MKENEMNFQTLHPCKRHGVSIPRHLYDIFKDYILKQIDLRKEVALDELIADAILVHSSRFESEVAWYLLTVKLDLEARGIIHVRIQTKGERRQIIRIKRSRLLYLNKLKETVI